MTKSEFYGLTAAAAGMILYLIGLFYLKGMGSSGFVWNMDGWFKGHLAIGCLGLLIAAGIVLLGYRRLLKLTPYATGIAVFLMFLTLFEPIVQHYAGDFVFSECEKKVLYFAAGKHIISFYPSEIVKIVFCMFLAVFCDWWSKKRRTLESGIIYRSNYGALLLLPVIFCEFLLAKQGDIKNLWLFHLAFMSAIMLIRPLAAVPLALLAVWPAVPFALLLFHSPYRYARFLESFHHQCVYGPSHIAFSSLKDAVWYREGADFSEELFELCNYAHSVFQLNDIIGRSGLCMLCIIVFLYIVLIAAGIMVAVRHNELKGKILCISATAFLFFQILQNLAVIFNVAPFTRVTAPFIGYGGSNLLFAFAALGFIVSVAFSKPAEVHHD